MYYITVLYFTGRSDSGWKIHVYLSGIHSKLIRAWTNCQRERNRILFSHLSFYLFGILAVNREFWRLTEQLNASVFDLSWSCAVWKLFTQNRIATYFCIYFSSFIYFYCLLNVTNSGKLFTRAASYPMTNNFSHWIKTRWDTVGRCALPFFSPSL